MKIRRCVKWKLVKVVWVDSSSIDAWQSLDSKGKPKLVHCVTVGRVVRHTKHALEIASTYTVGRDQVQGCFTIPTSAILGISELSVSKHKGDDE